MKTNANKTAARPREFDATKIHLDVVRSFLINHCGDFEWQPRALELVRSRSIKLLLDLADSVELDELHRNLLDDARTDVCAARFQRARQFVALVSKYQYSPRLINLDPEARALQTFVAAERRNKRLNTIFRAHFHRGTERHWSIPIVRKYFQRALGERPFIERILDGCDFSGGASTQHSGAVTHLAAKLWDESIGGSDGALYYFQEAVWRNEDYKPRFLPTDPKTGVYSYDRDQFRQKVAFAWEKCDYNILKVVTKNAKSGRTIAKEPPGNNLVQKGIDLELRRLLRLAYGIDLKHQEPNQLLALRGSLDVSDPYVTVDVKDASNSVITGLVRTLSNPFWFDLMNSTRSQNYRIGDDGDKTPYELFCSMGNGFCFPLETHIFAAICSAAYDHCGVRPDFRCYGDDIIVRQSVALVVIEILNACGFKVNTSKTFIHGPFRESCGANWYGGRDITPGYFKDPVTSLPELYARHNSLRAWPLIQQLLRAVPKKHHMVDDTPMYDWISNQAFVVPLDLAMSHPLTRYHPETHSFSYGILVELPVADKDWARKIKPGRAEGMAFTAAKRGSTFAEPFHLRFETRMTTGRAGAPPKGDVTFKRSCRENA